VLRTAADCAQGTGCHVITELPWYFGVAVFVGWAALVIGIVAILLRRRRNKRRQTSSGYELDVSPAPGSERAIERQ
jgi:hypothetical protein